MLNQIQQIIHRFLVKTGDKLPRIFLTKKEEAGLGMFAVTKDVRSKSSELYGVKIKNNDLATEIREKQLHVLKFGSTFDVLPEKDNLNPQLFSQKEFDRIKCGFEVQVCSNTQNVEVEVVADAFESLKLRWPKIQKWWPIKKKKVALEAKILYPYLDIKFPFNQHFVRFDTNNVTTN